MDSILERAIVERFERDDEIVDPAFWSLARMEARRANAAPRGLRCQTNFASDRFHVRAHGVRRRGGGRNILRAWSFVVERGGHRGFSMQRP